jgi:DNA modification methylase
MRDTILFGDCRETLKEFDGKARMCVTSPPYHSFLNHSMVEM